MPTLYDISGGAHFYNKADFGITVHRNTEENATEIHVQKVKFLHLGNKGMAKFAFNLNNHRYTERKDNGDVVWDNTNWLIDKLGCKEEVAGKKQLEFTPQSVYQAIYDNASTSLDDGDVFTEDNSPLPF